MTDTTDRSLYSHASLARLFAPKSVAIVGITPRANSFGGRTWGNLGAFQGRLYAVNPKYDRYLDQVCYPDLAALPEVPDCVIVATAGELVQGVLEQCAALGVGGAVVFASGYAETGRPEAVAAQQRMAELARQSGLRVLGPNCLGFVNNAMGAGLTFVTDIPYTAPSPHAIGIVSQSGAIGTALLQATSQGVSFSHTLTAGNSVDVDVADQIAYLAQEDSCKAIAVVFEGVSQPARLIEAGRMALRAGKPVVVFKVARSEEGARAAASHTGSLAGSDAAYAAAFERAGMVLVDDFEDLVETTVFMAKAAHLPAAAPGAAVLSISGGMAIMSADKAEVHGVPLPQPTPEVRAVLEANIPDFGSCRNPFDITAQAVALPQALGACAQAVFGSPDYGAVVFPHPLAQEASAARVRTIDEQARLSQKIACVPWITQWLEGPGLHELQDMTHVAVFHSLDACFRALRARHAWQAWRDAPQAQDTDKVWAERAHAARSLLRTGGSAALTEGEAMRLLSVYGVPVVEDRLATHADAAVEAANAIGYPVVMKIVSRDVPHKTEAGGVRLRIGDEAGVRQAWQEIHDSVARHVPHARIEGIVVQPMVDAGLELIVGAKDDPVFGPLIVVGLGGVFVELLRDACVRLAPVDAEEAEAMLRRLRGAGLFAGFRGSEAVDLRAVATIVAAVSRMATDLQDTVAEIDVNPLVCHGSRVRAVDALVTRRAPRVEAGNTAPASGPRETQAA